jgi:hypothetical protein
MVDDLQKSNTRTPEQAMVIIVEQQAVPWVIY